MVETEIIRGSSFLRCALAAINTAESVIPFASLASVLPVHGAITSTSRNFFGPIGSASGIVYIPLLPVIFLYQ